MTDRKHTPEGNWWCDNCRLECDESTVTYAEMHEACGHPVRWIQHAFRYMYDAAPDMLEVLEEYQWCKPLYNIVDWKEQTLTPGDYGCPCCGEDDEDGHTPDCKWGNAIKKARGE